VVAYAAMPRRLCYAASEAGGDASGGGDKGGLVSLPLPLPLPLPRAVDAVPPTRPGPDLMKWVKCVPGHVCLWLCWFGSSTDTALHPSVRLIAIGGLVLLLEAWAPLCGISMGLALAAVTRPSGDSLSAFLEARRQRALLSALAQGPGANVARRLLAAVDPTATVSGMHVLDCGACTLAHVVTVTEELTLIGAFGSWWVLTSASSTITVSLHGWWDATKQALGDVVSSAQKARGDWGGGDKLFGWAQWRWGELSRRRGVGEDREEGHIGSAPGQHHNH
jgi:hypothetical protein